MRKRQKLMLLIAIWLAIIIPAVAQEEMPVIVDPLRVSMTVFTNWQEIQLTYTIRWLDGYKPLFEMAEPEDMSFGDHFELDPVKGQKLIKINERKYKKENYADLIYYLRYIDEKKGDVLISEQTFHYIKQEPGKSDEGAEAKEFKVPGIMLRYDSVLTKDADDIIDRVDFGSFKRQENILNGLMGGLILIFGAAIFFMFRKPAIRALSKTSEIKAVSAGQAIDEQEERLRPKYALIFLGNKLFRLQAGLAGNPDSQKLRETKVVICNELRRFFLSYIPNLAGGEFTHEEIRGRISQIPEKRKRELLVILTGWLEFQENILYHEKPSGGGLTTNEVATLRKHVGDLNNWKIWRYNMGAKIQRFGRWLSGLSKLFRRRAK